MDDDAGAGEAVAARLETYCREAAEKRVDAGRLMIDAMRTTVLCSAVMLRERMNQ